MQGNVNTMFMQIPIDDEVNQVDKLEIKKYLDNVAEIAKNINQIKTLKYASGQDIVQGALLNNTLIIGLGAYNILSLDLDAQGTYTPRFYSKHATKQDAIADIKNNFNNPDAFPQNVMEVMDIENKTAQSSTILSTGTTTNGYDIYTYILNPQTYSLLDKFQGRLVHNHNTKDMKIKASNLYYERSGNNAVIANMTNRTGSYYHYDPSTQITTQQDINNVTLNGDKLSEYEYAQPYNGVKTVKFEYNGGMQNNTYISDGGGVKLKNNRYYVRDNSNQYLQCPVIIKEAQLLIDQAMTRALNRQCYHYATMNVQRGDKLIQRNIIQYQSKVSIGRLNPTVIVIPIGNQKQCVSIRYMPNTKSLIVGSNSYTIKDNHNIDDIIRKIAIYEIDRDIKTTDIERNIGTILGNDIEINTVKKVNIKFQSVNL